MRQTLKHGLSYRSEYRAWQMMRLRCTNPNNAAYPNYGGRGIRVCERWLNDPAAFLADMGPKPSPKHEIDRIDNDGNYEPGNCRWVLRRQNSRNRRSNVLIEWKGRKQALAAWAEETGVRGDTIKWRLRCGWSIEQALTTPAREKAPRGQGLRGKSFTCVDCGKAVFRSRCKSCENKRRWRVRRSA